MIRKLLVLIASATVLCSTALADSYEDAIDATMRNEPAVLAPILANGLDPNTISSGPAGTADPLISLAIRNNANKVVDLLLSQPNIDVNAPNFLHETPLMLAIYNKKNDLAKKLVEKGASVNNPGHWTPLHYAAASDNTEMVKFLIQKGADINARTLRGITPLYMAARDGKIDTVKALVNAGARKDFCTNDARAPYDIARERMNSQEVIDLLRYDHCR